MNETLIENPSKINRIALPKSAPVKKTTEKKDRKALLDFWNIATDIIQRIKAAPDDQPFYAMIGPEEAMDLLTINVDRNRPIDEAHIRYLAGQMTNDTFEFTSQSTIGYSKDGHIIDTQHRLWAIVDSGITLKFCIMKGIKPKAIANYDQGKNRSGRDILTINGYSEASGALANAIKNIILFNRSSQIKSSVSIRQVPNPEVEKFQSNKVVMDRLVKDLQYVHDVWMQKAGGFFTDHQWLTIYYILRTLPGMESKAKEFLDSFAKGVNMGENNPILVCRNYFINNFAHLTKGKDKKIITRNLLTYKVKHVFKAWELSCKKVRLTSFDVDKDLLIPKPYFGAF